MIISESMVTGFVARAINVVGRGSWVETWTNADGEVYDLSAIYRAVLATLETIEFVEVILPDELVAEIERCCCDPSWIKRLKGPKLLHPLLVNHLGEIVDGNHRAVKRSKLGHRCVPGVRASEGIMDAARLPPLHFSDGAGLSFASVRTGMSGTGRR